MTKSSESQNNLHNLNLDRVLGCVRDVQLDRDIKDKFLALLKEKNLVAKTIFDRNNEIIERLQNAKEFREKQIEFHRKQGNLNKEQIASFANYYQRNNGQNATYSDYYIKPSSLNELASYKNLLNLQNELTVNQELARNFVETVYYTKQEQITEQEQIKERVKSQNKGTWKGYMN